MSERADRLRAELDAVLAEEELADAMNAALDAYRADPTEEGRAVYRQAVEALAANRQEQRANRSTVTVVAESDESPEG